MKRELEVGILGRVVLAAGLWALACLPAAPARAAAGEPAAPTDAADLNPGLNPGTAGGAPPVPGTDAADASADFSPGAVPEGADPDWKSRDYDSLYALLQKYRDELRALRAKDERKESVFKKLDDDLGSMEAKLDSFQPLDGLKLHGDITTYYDDVYIGGPGAVPLMEGHYRTAVQRAELQLTYTRGLLHGLMEYDFQYLFGNQFDGPVFLGVEQVPAETGISQGSRQLYVELLTPLQIRIGTVTYSQTPLTVWREEDPDPFVPDVFSERRQRLRDDLLLTDDHTQVLQDGIRLQTGDAGLFGKPLYVSALFSQLGVAPTNGTAENATSPTNVGIDQIYQTATDVPTQLFETYDTYLAAGQVHYRFPSVGLDAGIQGTYVGDSPDSINRTYTLGATPENPALMGLPVPSFSSSVYGGSFSLTPTAWIRLDAESDLSSFNAPAVAAAGTDQLLTESDPTETGSATDLHLSLLFGWLKIKGRFLDVSQGFTSAAAQNRTWDATMSPMGPFDTENSRFDPQSNGFGELMAPRAPETIYNRVILPPEFWYQTSGGAITASDAKMPYDPTLDSIDPYGDATPNRMRYGGGVETDFLKHGLILDVDEDLATQISEEDSVTGTALPLESYNRLLAGGRFNLKPIWGWALRGSASFTLQSVADGGAVAFNSEIAQGGLEQDLWAGSTLELGYRHLDADGVLPYTDPAPFATPDPVLMGLGYEAYDHTYDQWAVGFTQSFGRDITFSANYGTLAFANTLVGQTTSVVESAPDFFMQQGYARLTLKF